MYYSLSNENLSIRQTQKTAILSHDDRTLEAMCCCLWFYYRQGTQSDLTRRSLALLVSWAHLPAPYVARCKQCIELSLSMVTCKRPKFTHSRTWPRVKDLSRGQQPIGVQSWLTNGVEWTSLSEPRSCSNIRGSCSFMEITLIVMFTKDCIWTVFWAIWFHSSSAHPIQFRSALILSSHLYRVILLSGFPTGIVYAFLIFSVSTTRWVHLILVILILFVEEYKLRSSSCRRFLQSPTSKYPPQSPETSLGLTYKHCTSLGNYEQNSGFVYLVIRYLVDGNTLKILNYETQKHLPNLVSLELLRECEFNIFTVRHIF